ncbi:MAG: alpha-glucan family phosphorylase [Planctomycetota bacterium]
MIHIPTLATADIELPRPVSGLYELAYNLWWTWSPIARRVFSMIQPSTWARYANPVEILINFERHQWEPLLLNDPFMGTYRAALKQLRSYLTPGEPTWFQKLHPTWSRGPVAYFSPEYGIDACLGIYSGGLGVLSGDHCKAASDLGVPFVGVGLLYGRGYFRQMVDAEGHQQHVYPHFDPARLPIRPAAGPTEREVIVSVPFPGREVKARVWVAQVGRLPVLLLDTDIPYNDPADRPITGILYIRGREMRLCQELLLGVGGIKALAELGISPSVWHLNEGHSGFLMVERLREMIALGQSVAEARESVRRNTVFTTHTPVQAGNEVFDMRLVEHYLEPLCQDSPGLAEEVSRLALDGAGRREFNMTALSLRLARSTNGVSRRHGQVATAMWHDVLAESTEGRPILSITNGIHTPTWIAGRMSDIVRQRFGDRWDEKLLDPDAWSFFEEIPDETLWDIRLDLKEQLLLHIRDRLRDQKARHGLSPGELRSVQDLFQARALTIGFARRFATYKRANLIFADADRLARLLNAPDRPVQLIFAGKAHPADHGGQQLVRRIFQLSQSLQFYGRLVFLENYSMKVASFLVQGCDVWLNNPRPPLEASGTSGMKAVVNGGLNLSILDGWWCEGFDERNGFSFGSSEPSDDWERRDWEDAQSFYHVLEEQIIPLYYDRDAAGIPHRWLAMMKRSLRTLTPTFSAARMVAEYVRAAYIPAAEG